MMRWMEHFAIGDHKTYRLPSRSRQGYTLPSGIIINEVKHIKTVLGESGKRKFALHAASIQELKVSCSNAPQAGQNVVEYTIANSSNKHQACVLYRGVKGEAPPYYFGNAFYAAYYGGINKTQVANYYDSLDIAAPNPANENAIYSLGLLETGTKEYLTCFVFLVPKSGTLKVLEGGIPDCSLLIDAHAYVVELKEKGTFKQFYSLAAIQQYTTQTGYSVAPPKDPYFVKSVSLSAVELNIPTNEIFPDQYAEKVS